MRDLLINEHWSVKEYFINFIIFFYFSEPGTDTPGPQPIGSAFVPFPNRDTQNRMPLVVPQPRTNNTNQENAHVSLIYLSL